MIKAVIFDMDEVIIDSEPIWDNYIINYLKEMDLEANQIFLRETRGVSSDYFWAQLKEMYNLPNSINFYVEDARSKYIEHLKKIDGLKPIDGIEIFINTLRQNKIYTALSTSGSKIRMNTIVNLFNMKDCFNVYVSAQDVKKAKPDPEIFLLTAEKLQLKPEECLVIEDSKNGITAANDAGMKCIGFKLEHNDQDLSNAVSIIKNFNINTFKELIITE